MLNEEDYEDPQWHVGEKAIRDLRPKVFASRSIRLTSPRLQAALFQCGVLTEELRPLGEEYFFTRSGDHNLARDEWESAEKLRMQRLHTVIEKRASAIKAAKEDKDGGKKVSGLMDRSTLLMKEKELVVKFEAKRQKKKAFEAAQAELFAAQTQQTIDAAAKKTSRSLAVRKQLSEDQAASAAARSADRSRKKQEHEDEMQRRNEAEDEARRMMEKREAEIAYRGRMNQEERERAIAERSRAFEMRRHESMVKCDELGEERLNEINRSTSRYTQRRDNFLRSLGQELKVTSKKNREQQEMQEAKLVSLLQERVAFGDQRQRQLQVKMKRGRSNSEMWRTRSVEELRARGQQRGERSLNASIHRIRSAGEAAAATLADHLERSSRASTAFETALAEKSSTIRTQSMVRTEKATRLIRQQEFRRFLHQEEVEKDIKLQAAKNLQLASLQKRRQRAMHELFLTEQRKSGAASAPPG